MSNKPYGYTQEQLDNAKDWDIQYIPEWALDYILYGDSIYYDDAPDLDGEEIKQITDWECNMIKKGFAPRSMQFIKWECDSEEYKFEIDPDPVPTFIGNPAFGLPCAVYRCLFVKMA